MSIQFSKLSSVNPSSTQLVASPRTNQNLNTQLKNILENGYKSNHDVDYISDQIFKLSQENPDWGGKYFLNDYQAIKNAIKTTKEFTSNLPLAYSSTDEFFLATVSAKTKGNQTYMLSEEDKKIIQNVAQDVLAGFALASGSALAAPLAQIIKQTWQTLMSTAATPQGQEIIKNTMDCLESIMPGTPLPTNYKGSLCYTADGLLKILKNSSEILHEKK